MFDHFLDVDWFVGQTACSLVSLRAPWTLHEHWLEVGTWAGHELHTFVRSPFCWLSDCLHHLHAASLGLLASILACLPTDQTVSGTLESWPVVAGQTRVGANTGANILLLVTQCSVLAGLCFYHYFVSVLTWPSTVK